MTEEEIAALPGKRDEKFPFIDIDPGVKPC